jgi:uncharacterized phage protein (TIGR01671 family)
VIYLTERYQFRAKKFGDSGFIYGNYAQFNHNGLKGDYIINACGIYRIKPGTVGQCTGLRDKNGNLIFQGDVVIDDRKLKGIVTWLDDGRWVVVSHHNGESYTGYVCKVPSRQVIGNIHDNSELTEV